MNLYVKMYFLVQSAINNFVSGTKCKFIILINQEHCVYLLLRFVKVGAKPVKFETVTLNYSMVMFRF